MIRSLGRLGVLLTAGLALLVTAYLLINTTFMLYDDEGYVLLTYQNFNAGGRLYDDIFSQYGPWPYVYHLAVDFILQIPLTHTIGRSLTAIHWTITALLVGAITARLTHQKIYALVATFASFGLLSQICNEPSHPGSMICVVLAAGTLLIINAANRDQWKRLGLVVGFITALLFLTKINIGLLLVAGAGVAALFLTAWPLAWRRTSVVLAAVGLLSVPWGLMGGNLNHPWVLILAIQFTLSAAGLLWVSQVQPSERRIPPQTWLVALGAFVVTLTIVSSVVCLRGTSLSELLQTVLFKPLSQPANLVIGFTWKTSVWPVTAVCWLLTAKAGWELRRHGSLIPYTRFAIITVRLIGIAVFAFHLRTWLHPIGIGWFVALSLPLLPIFLIPLNERGPTTEQNPSRLRLWVACIALPQVLHVYPVAGSQLGWGSFLLLPLMIAGIADTWSSLAHFRPHLRRWLPNAAAVLLLLISGSQLAMMFHLGWSRYTTSKPLDLLGAEDIRVDDRTRLVLRLLTLNAAIHADTLFSRQGMFSFNLWSGVPTPTAQNATHWFWLLDHPAQRDIIKRLQETPRSAIITNQILDDFLVKIHVPTDCPLQSFILGNYQPLFTLDSFYFLIPHGNRAAPFGRVEIFRAPKDSGTTETFLWQTNLQLNGRLDHVQVQAVNFPWQILGEFTPANARLTVQRINAAGDSLGSPIELPSSQPLTGLFQLRLFTARSPDLANPKDIRLVGLDANGNVLCESAF